MADGTHYQVAPFEAPRTNLESSLILLDWLQVAPAPNPGVTHPATNELSDAYKHCPETLRITIKATTRLYTFCFVFLFVFYVTPTAKIVWGRYQGLKSPIATTPLPPPFFKDAELFLLGARQPFPTPWCSR